MQISWYFLCFLFYSFLGWVWEICFCTYRKKRFENRGFLFGPICPIYGVCVLILQVAYDSSYFMKDTLSSIPKIFLISAIGSAIMEYATSFYLEKRFNSRWWDYSNVPLNLDGRIALPISLAFGVAGIILMKSLLPTIEEIYEYMPLIVIEISGLLLAAVFGADFAATEASLSTLLKKLKAFEEDFEERGEEIYQMLQDWHVGINFHQRYMLRNMRTFGKSYRRFGIERNYQKEIGIRILELVQKR